MAPRVPVRVKILWIILPACLAGTGISFSQNTKGDRPVPVSSSTRSKGSVKAGKGRSAKVAKTSPRNNVYSQQGPWVRNPSPSPGGGDRPSISPSRVPVKTSRRIETTPRGYNPWVNNPSSSPGYGDRPNEGGRTASGRKLVDRQPEDRSPFFYPADRKAATRFLPSPKRGDRPSTVRLPSSGLGLEQTKYRDSPYPGKAGDERVIRNRTQGRRPVKVYPSSGRLVRNQSASRTGAAEKGKPLKPLRIPVTSEGRRVTRVQLALKSISGTFIAPKKQNVYWGKISKNRERVVTDLAGRPLRRLNYRSPSIPIADRDTIPNQGKNIRRDTQGSSGKKAGYQTASRTGTAWQGDISGKQMRSRKADSRKTGRTGNWMRPMIDSRSLQPGVESPLKNALTGNGRVSGNGRDGKGFRAWLFGRPMSAGISPGTENRPIGVRGGSRPSYRMKGAAGGLGRLGTAAPFGKGGEAFSWQPQAGFTGDPGKRLMVGSSARGLTGQLGIGDRARQGRMAAPLGTRKSNYGLGGLFKRGGEAFSWQPQSPVSGGEGKRFMVGGINGRPGNMKGGASGWRPYGKGALLSFNGGRSTAGRPSALNAAGSSLRSGRRRINLGLDAFRLAGASPGSPGSGVRVPVGGVRRIESDYNSLKAIGYKGFPGAFGNSDLNVRTRRTQQQLDASIGAARSSMARRRPLNDLKRRSGWSAPGLPSDVSGLTSRRRPQARLDAGLGSAGSMKVRRRPLSDLQRQDGWSAPGSPSDVSGLTSRRRPQTRLDAGMGGARSVVVRRKPLDDLQKPTSRNPGGRPAIGSGLTIKRRPALLSMDNRRLQSHPSRAVLSVAVAQGRMSRVRPNPYMDDVMHGITYSGFKKYKKHHYVSLHTPSWVKLLRGDFRNNIKVLHPSDRADQALGSYSGNIRRNPFRNPYLDMRVAGAGKLYFRVVPNHPFETTGYPMTLKQERYVHAPMSSKEALKVKQPDKAYIRTALMQANVKMTKTLQSDLATDAAFYRRQEAMEQGKKGEKRSIRKMFASMIGRSTLIPPGLKAKLINPGYDPREKGLWAK